MLNDAPSEPLTPEEPPEPMRICAICDGFDALMRMSAWLVRLPANARRTDLSLSEAIEHLSQPYEQAYDQIIIAPDTGKTAAPKLVNSVLQLASERSDALIVLLPPGARMALASLHGLQVHYGPPFALPEDHSADRAGTDQDNSAPAGAEPPSARSASGLLARLLRPALRQSTNQNRPERPKPPELPAGPCRVVALQPVSGGAGATTIAVNLASELSRLADPPEVCLIDLNLQFGNVNTYLDMPGNSRINDAYRQLSTLDFDSFQSCLQKVGEHLRIFATPTEILPIDGISERDLRQILALARESADLVLLDLPHFITDWSGAAWAEADIVFTICRADLRSAQNMQRLSALLQTERLGEGRRYHLLNAVPPRPDTTWKTAIEGFEKGLGGPFFLQLADGGEEVANASNSGAALWRSSPANPLRTGIAALGEMLAARSPRRQRQGQAGVA